MKPADLLFAALLLPLPIASAQGPSVPCISEYPQGEVSFPLGIGLGGVGLESVVLGDFNGDLAQDAIALSGGDLLLVSKPNIYEVAAPLVTVDDQPIQGVSALCSYEITVGIRHEAFAFTDDEGLHSCDWFGESFGSPDTLSDLVAWKNASPVRSANLDGANGPDLYGITADRKSVVVMGQLRNGWAPTSVFPLGDAALQDVVALDWDGDGKLELAVLADVGVIVLEIDGDVRALHPNFQEVGAIQAVEVDTSTGEQVLAWARTNPDLDTELVLLSANYSGVPMPLDFNFCDNPVVGEALLPFALVAGNFDEANGDDLLLAHSQSAPEETLIVLRSTGAAPYFDTTDSDLYEVVTLDVEYGVPAFGQLDEGPDDLLIPLPAIGQLEVYTELPWVNSASAMPSNWKTQDIIHQDTEYSSLDPQGNVPESMQLAFRVPVTYRGFEAIEMILWGQSDPPEENFVQLESHLYHTMSGQPGAVDEYQFITIDNLPAGFIWNPRPHYYTEFRFIDLNASKNRAVKASKTFLGGFTLQSNNQWTEFGTEFDYLHLHTSPGGLVFEVEDSSSLANPSSSSPIQGPAPRIVVGAYASPLTKVPFDPEDTPWPGPIVEGTFASPFTPSIQ